MRAAKIALVAIMTSLSVFNRYVLVPRMARSRTEAINALRLAMVAEMVLGIVVVGLVSVFGLLEQAERPRPAIPTP